MPGLASRLDPVAKLLEGGGDAIAAQPRQAPQGAGAHARMGGDCVAHPDC